METHAVGGGLARMLAASGTTGLAALKGMGLGISQAELEQLAQARCEALAQSGRIEFGSPALLTIAEAFTSSPFLEREHSAEQLEALQAVFYSARADVPSSIPDDELVDGMRAAFDGCCGGDLDALAALSAQELLSLASTSCFDNDDDDPEPVLDGPYSITDDEGRTYTWDPDAWHDDIYASGWHGERWDDEL
ncbi:MAG: DUF6323 family protein [Coriobacteriales bacterium]